MLRLFPLPRPRFFQAGAKPLLRTPRPRAPRALSQGKGSLFTDTTANFDYSSLSWEETVKKNAYKKSSPVTRIIVWTILLTGPIIGYVYRDEVARFATRTMASLNGKLPGAMTAPASPPVATHAPSIVPPIVAPRQVAAPPPPHQMTPARLTAQAPPSAAPPVAAVAQRSGPSMPAIQMPNERSGAEVVALRGNDGHFRLDSVVNGVPMQMMFDTGASGVMLRAEDAARFGADPSTLTYSITIETANGVSHAAPLTIETLSIGAITVHHVPAIVAKRGALGVNLLGQSFMTRLAGFTVEGNKMVLRGR